MSQIVESRLLESTPDTEDLVKIMEKGSHVFVVDNFSARGVGMGKSIDSRPFVVGGYSFIIQVYPDGGNPYSHSHGNVSLFVMNVSPKPAQVVYDFFILGRGSHSGYDLGYSTYDRTDIYHQVYYVPPGSTFGLFHFVHRSSIPTYCLQNDCIMIRANIGVVLDHPPMPMPSLANAPSSSERCILFQVGDSRYYALESLITTRCPTLLSDYPLSNNIVVISDVEPRVFTAVLWFLCNGMLCLYDRQAVGNSKDSFGAELLAAADKLKWKDLRSECRSSQMFFGGYESKKKIWRKVCSWLDPQLHLVKED